MGKPVVVRILGDASSFQDTMGKVEGSLNGFSGSLGKIGAAVGTAFGVSKVVGFFSGTMGAASDLNETVSKTGVIFGNSGTKILDWSKTASSAFGQSQRSALDAATTFATVGKAAGLSGDDLASFSMDLTELSSDLASFHNTSPEEAIQAIGAALRGEAEPMRRYGVLLDDATLRQQAMKMGLIETTKDALTPAQKSLAAYQLILAQTKDAQGDYQRTADGTANTERRVAAQWEDSKAKIGQALLPAYGELLSVLSNDLIPVFEEFIGPVTDVASMFLQVAGAALGLVAQLAPVIESLGAFGGTAVVVGLGVMKLVDGAEAAQKAMQGLAVSAGTTMGALGLVAALVAGVAVASFMAMKKEQEKAKETADALSQAYRDAQDPVQTLTDRMATLADEMRGVSDETDGASDAAEKGTASWAAAEAQQRGVIDTTNRLGLSAQELADIVADGTDIYHESAAILRETQGTTDGVRRATQDYTQSERDRIAVVLDAIDAGRISREEGYQVLRALDDLADATDDVRGRQSDQIRTTLELALSTGKVTDEWLRQHGIVDLTKASYDQLLAAGQALDSQNPVTEQSTRNTTSAVEDQGDKLSDTEQAAKDLEDQLKDLQTAQDEYYQHTFGVMEAEDNHRLKLLELTEAHKEAAGQADGNTRESIRLRDAQREVVGSAAEVIAAMAAQGASEEEQRASLQRLADDAYNTAIAMGQGAESAEHLRQKILGIPTSHTVNVEVRVRGAEGLEEINVGGRTYRASGGPAGGVVRVGERGPEDVILPRGSNVVPNHKLGRSGGGGEINVYVQSNADPAMIANEISWQMRTAGV